MKEIRDLRPVLMQLDFAVRRKGTFQYVRMTFGPETRWKLVLTRCVPCCVV